jgi:hypothetical protein
MSQIIQHDRLDKFARDARTWRDVARINHAAAVELFQSENNIITCIPAATLAHLTLEMFLKAALLVEGMTVFDPKCVKRLDPSLGLSQKDCVWGHCLVEHAKRLSERNPKFDLTDTTKIPFYFPHEGPMTLQAGFAIFDPFFFELRYPGELADLDGVGPGDILMFQSLVEAIQPFLQSIP